MKLMLTLMCKVLSTGKHEIVSFILFNGTYESTSVVEGKLFNVLDIR